MGKEVRGIITGAVASVTIHLVALWFPISLTPVIEVRELPGSMEVSLVAHKQAQSIQTHPEVKKEKKVVRPHQQTIEAPARETLPMAEVRVRTPENSNMGATGGRKRDRRGDSFLAIPRYVGNPKPPYPQIARRRGYEGTVRLEVEVLATGRVGRIRVKESSRYEVLDRSALNTVKGWRFIPAKVGGVPVKSTVIVPITFQIKDKSRTFRKQYK